MAREASDLWARRQRSRGGPAGPQRSRIPHTGHAGDCRPAGWHLAGAAVEDDAADDSPPGRSSDRHQDPAVETRIPMTDTIMTWSSVQPAIAEIYLVAAICVVLLVDVFVGEKRRGLTSTVTLIALAIGAALTVA